MPRHALFLAFFIALASLVLASPERASAGVTGIDFAPAVADRPETVTVEGSGPCQVDVTIGTSPAQFATLAGTLPLTETVDIKQPGTYPVHLVPHPPFGNLCSTAHDATLTVTEGNFGDLTVSKASSYVGDDVAFTIGGIGRCGFTLSASPAWPGSPQQNLQFQSVLLPFTLHQPMTQPGAFRVTATPSTTSAGDPAYCRGASSSALATAETVAMATPAPGTQTGNIVDFTASAKQVSQGDTVQFTVFGSGTCSLMLSGLPDAPKMQTIGKMPMNFFVKMNSVGTFTTSPIALGVPGAPGNCNTVTMSQTVVVDAAPATRGSVAGIQVTPQAGGLWRPDTAILYTQEPFTVSVSGGAQSSACTYEIAMTNLDTQAPPFRSAQTHFGDTNFPGLTPGLYRITAAAPSVNSGYSVPECSGTATATMRVLDPKGWITGMDVVGFAFHFNAHDDMAMPQFCSNCTTIFSPAHDRSFLGINAHTNGGTTVKSAGPTGECAYHITAARGSDVRGGEGTYINGQPGTPVAARGLAFDTSGAIGNPNAPYWYMYNDSSDTVTVTIGPSQQQTIPSCYIVNGKVVSTITFTENTNLPPVKQSIDNKP